MTLRDDLIAAKALIDTEEKWGKGQYEDDRGCLCALGAIRKHHFGTAGDGVGFEWLGDATAVALKGALGTEWAWQVADFNDHPDTTHADVMALFNRAIAAAGEQ